MRQEHISDALNMLHDDIIEETDKVRNNRKRQGKKWLKWGAVAACLCLIVAAGALIHFRTPVTKDINSLLDTIGNSGDVEQIAIFDYIMVENRAANYEQVYVGKSQEINTPVSDESTSILKDYLGELYQESATQITWDNSVEVTCNWYYPIGSNNLKYLIKEADDGTLSLWIFSSFVVADFSDKEYIEEEKAFYDATFPGADLSAYTYGEVYNLIYGVDSAEDIVSITAYPSNANNTDFGKQIQREVGTHTYTDRDDIGIFYANTVDLLCYGESGWSDYYDTGYRFSYNFSTDAEDKLTSGEQTYATRFLTITLADGTTIDSWKYDALRGCFYEYGGISTAPLSESAVFSLNDIWGIK